MPARVSTFGRRFYKLTQLLEEPNLWRLHRNGVGLDTFRRFNRPWFKDAGINTVIDIGANTGQFAQLLHMVLPDAQIYSFEPLPDCFSALLKRTVDFDKFKAFNVGLGSVDGTLTFYRNPYTDSSSFRPMTALHRRQFPFTASRQSLMPIPVRTLDSFKSELELQEKLFVKIDVQGFEDEVIEGGKRIISRAEMVLVEVSFAPLYEGVPAFEQLNHRMRRLGFEFRGCVDQLIGPLDGAILQADALYIRTGARAPKGVGDA